MQLADPLRSPSTVATFRRHLRVLEREVMRQLQAETTCCGVTLAQCHVLLELSATGSLSLKDLVAILGLDKSTLSRTADSLVKAGLVNRVVDPSDRRAVRMTCNSAGLDRVASIDQACNRQYAALLSRTSLERRRSIIEAVQFLADAMSRLRRDVGGARACRVRIPPDHSRKPHPAPAAGAGARHGSSRKDR